MDGAQTVDPDGVWNGVNSGRDQDVIVAIIWPIIDFIVVIATSPTPIPNVTDRIAGKFQSSGQLLSLPVSFG